MGLDKVSELQEALYRAAKADVDRRFHALYDKTCRADVLTEAWARVRANGGAAGVDGTTIREIEEESVPRFLEGLARELRERTYRPSPLRRVWIPKPNGKKRGLGIPTVKDRVAQTAVKLLLEPIFEADFEPFSFGFRPGRSAHDAVAEVVKWLNFGCESVVDADISGCFDNIPKDRLVKAVARGVSDGAVLKLIRQWLNAGLVEGESLQNPVRGTPQGSPLSPLLANIYLDQLDKGWKRTGLAWRGSADAHLVRYADDFVILTKHDIRGVKVTLDSIMRDLGLTLSPEKTRIVEAEEGFDFLGFHFLRRFSQAKGKRVTWWFPSAKSKRKIRERVHALTDTRALARGTFSDATLAVVDSLRGWGEYFRHSNASAALDHVWLYAFDRLAWLYRRYRTRGRVRRKTVGWARDLLRAARPTTSAYGRIMAP